MLVHTKPHRSRLPRVFALAAVAAIALAACGDDDDDTPAARRKMKSAEDSALSEITRNFTLSKLVQR